MTELTYEALLDWRGICRDDACYICGGAGRRTYPDTSTWRRAVGGQTLTNDVCDACWGSGTMTPWPSHKSVPADQEACARMYEIECGVSQGLRLEVAELRAELDRIDQHEQDYFVDRVLSLADVHAEDSREDGVRLMSRGALIALAREIRSIK